MYTNPILMKWLPFNLICKRYYTNIISTPHLEDRNRSHCMKGTWSWWIFTPAYETTIGSKILFQIPGGTTTNQLQLVTNIPNRRGVESAGLGKKIPGTQPLIKQKLFLNHLRFKGEHYLLKNMSSNLTKSASTHICGMEKNTESYTKGKTRSQAKSKV